MKKTEQPVQGHRISKQWIPAGGFLSWFSFGLMSFCLKVEEEPCQKGLGHRPVNPCLGPSADSLVLSAPGSVPVIIPTVQRRPNGVT